MKATVLMRQPGRVQEIVGSLRKGGGDRLQVSRGARSGRLGRVPVAGEVACPGRLRVAAENVQASLQPLEIARDLRASLFCLGGEPTCPKT